MKKGKTFFIVKDKLNKGARARLGKSLRISPKKRSHWKIPIVKKYTKGRNLVKYKV